MMSRAKAFDKNQLSSVMGNVIFFGTIVRMFSEMRDLRPTFFETLNQEMSSSRL